MSNGTQHIEGRFHIYLIVPKRYILRRHSNRHSRLLMKSPG